MMGHNDLAFLEAWNGGGSLITRSSYGQMLILANMLSKMKHGTPMANRIAEVHNAAPPLSATPGGTDLEQDAGQ